MIPEGNSKYIPFSKNVYTILDNMEQSFNKHSLASNNNHQITFIKQNNLILDKKQQMLVSNTNFQSKNILALDQSSIYNIKQIIREEFASMILSYQKDMYTNINKLESKINNINFSLNDRKNNDYLNNTEKININKNPKSLLYSNEYLLKAEYETKIMEYDQQFIALNAFMRALKDTVENKFKEGNDENSKTVNNIVKNNEDKINIEYNLKEISLNIKNMNDQFENHKKK